MHTCTHNVCTCNILCTELWGRACSSQRCNRIRYYRDKVLTLHIYSVPIKSTSSIKKARLLAFNFPSLEFTALKNLSKHLKRMKSHENTLFTYYKWQCIYFNIPACYPHLCCSNNVTDGTKVFHEHETFGAGGRCSFPTTFSIRFACCMLHLTHDNIPTANIPYKLRIRESEQQLGWHGQPWGGAVIFGTGPW
jgi:hypothetical protein